MEVRGLSSAASIWFTASLGVTVAASSPLLGVVALVLALITLSDRRILGSDTPQSREPGTNADSRGHRPTSQNPSNHKAQSDRGRGGEGGDKAKHPN
jgi:uncharacterized membrane protein YhiD involved in acid resistance